MLTDTEEHQDIAPLTVSMGGTVIIQLKTLLQNQALGDRQQRGERGREGGDKKVPLPTANLLSSQFYLDGLCFSAPRTNHALRLSSFFSLFLSSVRVCVGVEAW